MNTQEILKNCTIEGTVIKLPEGQLDRKVYMDIKKALEGIGGKWKGGKVSGFEFPQDPSELLGRVSGGEKVNLKKDFQFFGTPDKLCDKLVEIADLNFEDRILEPSAGDGAILRSIQRNINELIHFPCCYELMPQNRKKLEEMEYIDLLGENFLDENTGMKFDKIIANPPFTKGQDIEHLRKMYDMLDSEGTVVCITSLSWMSGKTKKPTAFRDWLCDDKEETSNFDWDRFSRIGTDTQFYRANGDRVYLEMIDAGAFKESGTNVRTVIVVIEKQD